MTNTMRRWVLQALGRNHLEQQVIAIPNAGPGQVLVKVQAVSLNYRDKLVIETGLSLDHGFPFAPFSDMAGVVAAVGPGAADFAPGDRVISVFMPDWIDGAGPTPQAAASSIGGSYDGVLAEYVAVPQHFLTHAPARLDAAEACTLPIAGLTAWFALIEAGALKAGQSVVVQGTGGVALFGLQIAKAHGARVIVTSSSNDKLERAHQLGADGLVNYREQDWAAEVRRLTDGRGADHILEIAGGANLARSLEAAALGGRIWLIGLLAGLALEGSFAQLARRRLRVEGIRVGHRRALDELIRAVDAIGLTPVIGQRFAFDQVQDALDLLDQGPFGKIVIDVAR